MTFPTWRDHHAFNEQLELLKDQIRFATQKCNLPNAFNIVCFSHRVIKRKRGQGDTFGARKKKKVAPKKTTLKKFSAGLTSLAAKWPCDEATFRADGNQLTSEELQVMCRLNNVAAGRKKDECVDAIASAIGAGGALPVCPKCKHGQLRVEGNFVNCPGKTRKIQFQEI